MKKIKYLLIAIIMFVMPLVVLAKTNIEGTDIVNIKVPENWKLYMKENLDDMMIWLGYDAEKTENYKYAWLNNSYFFDLVSEDKNTEIILIKKISEFEIDDLSIYQDEDINDSFSEIKKAYAAYETNINLYTTGSGIKYYKIEYKDENANINIIDYITNIHGNMYQYKVQSNVELSKDLINDVEKIIDSIEYDNYLTFVKNNTITEVNTKSGGSSIILIFILLLIIGGAVAVYILINKKKNTYNNSTIVYTDAKPPSSNPAVADFINSNDSESIQRKEINLNQSNKNNE